MPFPRIRCALLALLAAGLCSDTARAGPKPEHSAAEPAPITVDATPIKTFRRFDDSNGSTGKLTFHGGLVLTSPSSDFGGWSGLVLSDDAKTFLAISDAGSWMTGRITYDGTSPSGISDARLGPVLNSAGVPFPRSRDRDSEAIALESGTLEDGSVLVAFERRHRIEHYRISAAGLSNDLGPLKLPDAAKSMRRNQGLEAMTVMKGGPYKGSVIAFSERLYDAAQNHTGWLWTGNGPQTIHLKNIGDYDLTDLSSLDDGTLFVLERRFRWFEGVKMRLRRIVPGELSPGATITGETLIEADLNSNIDNMEGLAVTRLTGGEVLVTMVSDNNFTPLLQRNLLLQFTVNDAGQQKARPLD